MKRDVTGRVARVTGRAASSSWISPSPPSDGGEGWGEEVRFYWFPLSSVLSPLVPRGERMESLMQPRALSSAAWLAGRETWSEVPGENEFSNDFAFDQVLLDNLFEHRRRAGMIPNRFRIN